jgi:ATP synthase protein I
MHQPSREGPEMPEKNPAPRTKPHVTDPTGAGDYNAGISLFSYIVGGIVVWSLVGWWLDSQLGTGWIALVGALVGAAGGLYLAHVHHLTRAKPQDPPAGPRGSGDEPGGK